jgi:hypothetical protein
MHQNSRPTGRPLQQDEVTVRLTGAPGQAAAAQGPPPDGVTVLVPGSVLAPAPTPHIAGAGEAPVFVDDSGNRKRLLRLAGMLIALLSIGFMAIVGVALAVPNVANSVGLGDVMPFIVPGGAVVPPTTAPPTPRVQAVLPKAKPRPAIAAAPATEREHVDVDANTTSAPVTQTTMAAQASATPPPTTQAPATQAPATGDTPAHGGQAPANPAGDNAVPPTDPAPQN